MKTGPKLNLIKKFGERGGGNPTSLTSELLIKNNFGEGGGGGTETKTTLCVK